MPNGFATIDFSEKIQMTSERKRNKAQWQRRAVRIKCMLARRDANR